MSGLLKNTTYDDEFAAGPPSKLLDRLASGEKLIWSGRPVRLGLLVRQSLQPGLFGLAFVAFTLLWCFGVAKSGLSPSDRTGIEPYAAHNVAIALAGALVLLPAGFALLGAPFRAWWTGRRTWYLLTDRRAIIAEPCRSGGWKTVEYPPEAVALMRSEESADGSGSLVFRDRPGRFNPKVKERSGFLAIDRVREVGVLVRTTFAAAHGAHGGVVDPWKPPAVGSGVFSERVFELTPGGRTAVLVRMAFVLLVVGSLLLPLVAIPVGLCVAMSSSPKPFFVAGLHEPAPFLAQAGLGIVGLAAALCLIYAEYRICKAMSGPIKIVINHDREIEFRSWLRSVTVRASDLTTISGMRGTVIRHKGGKIHLLDTFPRFEEFLLTVKALNPSVEIKGF
jgi:hypothetical protein